MLACSPRAVLSHRSAADLWDVVAYPAGSGPVHVSVAGRNPGLQQGIRIHRSTSLRRGDVTTRYGIPTTTPDRTLLDLAGELGERELERAVAEAFALGRTTRAGLLSSLERHPGRPGIGRLRSQLGAQRDPARTRSMAEERLLAAIREAGLPEPRVNVRIGRWEVDLLWPRARLVVEVDGYASHSSRRAFERDHAKSAELRDAGYALLRFSANQVRDEPERTVERIRSALREPAG